MSAEPLASSPAAEPQLSPQASRPSSPQTPASPAQLPSAVAASPPPAEPLGGSRPASPQDPPAATANGKETPNVLNLENVSLICSNAKTFCLSSCRPPGTDRSSPVPPSASPAPIPASAGQASPLSQPPLILQPLASPLQVGVPPMSLPIILNPALIEATSPVPLLSGTRSSSPSEN